MSHTIFKLLVLSHRLIAVLSDEKTAEKTKCCRWTDVPTQWVNWVMQSRARYLKKFQKRNPSPRSRILLKNRILILSSYFLVVAMRNFEKADRKKFLLNQIWGKLKIGLPRMTNSFDEKVAQA